MREAERRPPWRAEALAELRDAGGPLKDDPVAEIGAGVGFEVVEDLLAEPLAGLIVVVESGGDGDEHDDRLVVVGSHRRIGSRWDVDIIGGVLGPRRVVEDRLEVGVPVGRQHERVVFERFRVAFDAEIQEERRGGVRPVTPVVGAVLRSIRGKKVALDVVGVRVRDDRVGAPAPGGRPHAESLAPGVECGHLTTGFDLDAEFGGEVRDPVDDRRDAARRVVHAEVVIDVGHERVDRRRVVRRTAEEDQRVLQELLELGVLEALAHVLVHRIQERHATGGSEQPGIETVPQPGAIPVDELLDADLVGVFGPLEIRTERLAAPRLVGVEEVRDRFGVVRHVDAVAVLPEDAVMRIESGKVVVRLGVAAEVPEKPLERIGHEIPRWPGIDPEAVGLDPAGDATEILVSLEDGHVGAVGGEIAGGRQTAETAANDRNVASLERSLLRAVRRVGGVGRFHHIKGCTRCRGRCPSNPRRRRGGGR